MKNLIYILLIFMCSCQSNVESNKASSEVEEKDTVETKGVFIQNEKDYSTEFCAELRKMGGYERIDLQGNLMILNGQDTVTFPDFPKINYEMVFTGKKDNLGVILTIRRLNQTAIEYQAEMAEFGKWTYMGKGIAELSPMFYLGGESDIEEETGESYFATEFSEKKDTCYTNIRIGQLGDGENGAYLVKLIKNCNGKIQDIDLDNFPVLKEK